MSPSETRQSLLGSVVAGRYQVLRLIGKGGMGSIYEVEHCTLGRRFALKTLTPERVGVDTAMARFRREADVIARLRHPHIVDIVDWDSLEDGSPCIVMELLRGEDLAERIRRTGPMPWTILGRLADQVLSALSVAHRAGVVHRDLKPSNVFLAWDDAGEERAVLLDFGISKVRDTSVALTEDKMLGTPLYMAPEQVDQDFGAVDTAADVWAMGAILFEMATGVRAFRGTEYAKVLHRICYGAPESMVQFRPEAPAAFVEVIARTLSRDARERLTEVEELREGVRTSLEPVAPGAFVEPLRANTPDDSSVGDRGSIEKPGPTSRTRTAIDRAPQENPETRSAIDPLLSTATDFHGAKILSVREVATPTGEARPLSDATSKALSPGKRSRYAGPLVVGVLVVVGLVVFSKLDRNTGVRAPAAVDPLHGVEVTTGPGTTPNLIVPTDAVPAPNQLALPRDSQSETERSQAGAIPASVSEGAEAEPSETAEPSRKGSAALVRRSSRPKQVAPRSSTVVLRSEPDHAAVFDGETRLGQTPLEMTLERGISRRLRVQRKCFHAREVVIDGSRASVKIRLEVDPFACQ